MKEKIKIGIVGCGTIGGECAGHIVNKLSHKASLEAVADMDKTKAKELIDSLQGSQVKLMAIDQLITAVDLVIEAASAKASAEIAKKSLEAGKDVLIMSIGGLVGKEDVLALAEEKNCNLYLPTGAIAGLDCVKAGKIAGITSAMIITRKPPQGLAGAPYIIEHDIDLESIDKETVIFEGTAKEAVPSFPKNINVAAVLSFSGIGTAKTKVRIMTSPDYTTNSHEIVIEGAFGKMTAKTENVPSPHNPKTSYLAVLSAIASLEKILSNVKIGT